MDTKEFLFAVGTVLVALIIWLYVAPLVTKFTNKSSK